MCLFDEVSKKAGTCIYWNLSNREDNIGLFRDLHWLTGRSRIGLPNITTNEADLERYGTLLVKDASNNTYSFDDSLTVLSLIRNNEEATCQDRPFSTTATIV